MARTRDTRNRNIMFADVDWETIGKLAQKQGMTRGKWVEMACKELAEQQGATLVGTRQHGGHRLKLDQQAIADTLMGIVNRSRGDKNEGATLVVKFENGDWKPDTMRAIVEESDVFILDWPTVRYTGAPEYGIAAVRALLEKYAQPRPKRKTAPSDAD